VRRRRAGAGAGAVREYFIAALQGVWDYAPLGSNACVGQPSSYNDTANGFMQDNATALALGRRQIKAQYVEFTDATFTVRKARAPLRSDPPCPCRPCTELVPGSLAAGRGLAAPCSQSRGRGVLRRPRTRAFLCCVGA
jgi:hypothetical protein